MTITKFWPSLAALFLSLSLLAGDEPPRPKVKDADRYAALSGLLQKTVVSQLPKVIEDSSGWGRTIPIPDKLRNPKLRRTRIQVGDHQELPQGSWWKVRLWLDNPARDLQVRVRDLRQLKAGSYRLEVDAGAALHSEADLQQWLKGLLLADLVARADLQLGLSLVVDVTVTVTGKLPPEIKVAPKVKSLKVDLKEFRPQQVTFRRAGFTLAGDLVERTGEDLRGILQEVLRVQEPQIRERANAAIAQAIRTGQGTVSTADLLKALTPKRQKD
jgi:hypothetical protein